MKRRTKETERPSSAFAVLGHELRSAILRACSRRMGEDDVAVIHVNRCGDHFRCVISVCENKDDSLAFCEASLKAVAVIPSVKSVTETVTLREVLFQAGEQMNPVSYVIVGVFRDRVEFVYQTGVAGEDLGSESLVIGASLL